MGVLGFVVAGSWLMRVDATTNARLRRVITSEGNDVVETGIGSLPGGDVICWKFRTCEH
jgi:hypothetical protein